MARQHVRAEASLDAVGRRLYGSVLLVRTLADPGGIDPVSHHPGRDRRRPAAVVTSRAPRSLPAAGSRQGDGFLGAWHRRGADSRTGTRRLADRKLQLALGVLYQ